MGGSATAFDVHCRVFGDLLHAFLKTRKRAILFLYARYYTCRYDLGSFFFCLTCVLHFVLHNYKIKIFLYRLVSLARFCGNFARSAKSNCHQGNSRKNAPAMSACPSQRRGRAPLRLTKMSRQSRDIFVKLERIMGVEPTTSAWEANVLPINYIRVTFLFYHFFLCLSRVYCEKIRKTLSDRFR